MVVEVVEPQLGVHAQPVAAANPPLALLVAGLDIAAPRGEGASPFDHWSETLPPLPDGAAGAQVAARLGNGGLVPVILPVPHEGPVVTNLKLKGYLVLGKQLVFDFGAGNAGTCTVRRALSHGQA